MTKRHSSPAQLRNLTQYKGMTDEEFDEAMGNIPVSNTSYEDFEKKVKKKMLEFEKDYDLSDMKFNDTETLQNLCKALVTLEDYEKILVELRSESIGKNLTMIDKLSSVMSNIRKDVSRMQEDLKITRKIRKSTQEESARAELARQKKLAMEFYQKKMFYVYCEKCVMLLTTTWFLYPTEKNILSIRCGRTYTNDEGKKIGTCGHINKITSRELLETRGTNHPEGFDF